MDDQLPVTKLNSALGEILRRKPLISIVCPCYNEEPMLPLYYEAMERIVFSKMLTFDFELILINDGSKDKTLSIIRALALKDERVATILVTHTHRDHSPLAARLKDLTGAPILGAAPHFTARDLVEGEYVRLDAGADYDYAPDRVMADGDVHHGDGYTLTAIETPGHTANHLAFALHEDKALLSGDHVMAWSTTTVAPPDGAMGDYMASIQKLMGRDERVFWPGHGGPVTEPHRFMRALQSHRRQREASILDRLAAGDETIPTLVANVYQGLNPDLVKAAGMNVFAHLEDLVARGLAQTDGPPRLDSHYRRA